MYAEWLSRVYERLCRLHLGQPVGQLRAVVADHVVDRPAVVAAVLGGPQAEPERVRVDLPVRVLGLQPLEHLGRRLGRRLARDHSEPPAPPNTGRPSSSGPTVPESRSAASPASQEPGRLASTAAVPPSSAARRASARAIASATSS